MTLFVIFILPLYHHKVICVWKDPKDKVHNHLALHFEYKSSRGVDDALCTLMNLILSHFEIAKSFVRLVSIDFSALHPASHFS